MSCLPNNLERIMLGLDGGINPFQKAMRNSLGSLRWCRDLTHNQIYSPVTNLRASHMSAQHIFFPKKVFATKTHKGQRGAAAGNPEIQLHDPETNALNLTF